jgi:hypothetical protein
MRGLKELAIALVRVILGLAVVAEGIVALAFIEYATFMGSIYDDKVVLAYESSYDKGYSQTYDSAYQEAFAKAYDKGYEKWYEVGLESGSTEGAGIRVELHNPTYKELREFLAVDETNLCMFVSGEFVCSDFAAQLNNNAEANGIRTAYVRIRSENWGHALVAFETVDRGLIFIEPQSDKELELVIGEPFPWYLVGAISPLSSRDPLVEIQIIW